MNWLGVLDLWSVLLRLLLAVLFGGFVGMERSHKRRGAGFRTYMLVCLGATLTMLLGEYLSVMLDGDWKSYVQDYGARSDVSRIGAQVINGVGFLGAGTIIVTGRLQVKGLTTAAGLWASACMGLAIGAGFYECVIVAMVLMCIILYILPFAETHIVEKAPNMNIYIEFFHMDCLSSIITALKAEGIQIYEVSIEQGSEGKILYPSAILFVRIPKHMSHTQVLAMFTHLKEIHRMEEI